jgi:hypothetical protein
LFCIKLTRTLSHDLEERDYEMPRSYYPPEPLKEALSIPRTIYEKGASKPMFRVTLAEELTLSSGGVKFRDLVTASSGYGLTSGSRIADKIELQQRGLSLAEGKAEEAIEALLSIEVFQQFYDHFGSGGSRAVPTEKVAKDFLMTECGIPERQVEGVLINILKDARDWYLIQNIAGGEKFVPADLAKEKLKATFGVAATPTSPPEALSPLSPKPDKPVVDVVPKLQLNIEIHIAADTPEEKIETIFKNMKKYLLTNE